MALVYMKPPEFESVQFEGNSLAKQVLIGDRLQPMELLNFPGIDSHTLHRHRCHDWSIDYGLVYFASGGLLRGRGREYIL